MDRDRPPFGVLLRHYRLKSGLTQQALAERASLSLRGLSDLERGIRRVPYADTIDRLIEALELGPSDRAIFLSAGRRVGPGPAVGSADRASGELHPAALEVRHQRQSSTDASMPFVGRQAEFGLVQRLLEAASRGQGRFVLLSGEPGIGKTRLALEIADVAEPHGWKVLYGRATAVDGAPAYLPIIEALSSYIDACPAETLRIQLGEAAADVALLLPAIRHRLVKIPYGSAPGTESSRYRLLGSVSDFLLAIARASNAGLLLVLEDLHWADESTLLLLRFLAPKLTGSALLVLGTHRSADVDLTPTLSELLADLSRAGTGEHIALAPLSAADVSSLVTDLRGAPVPAEVVQTLYARTDGNPFFLASVLQQLASTGCDLGDANAIAMRRTIPHNIRWVIRERLSRLSPTTNDLLRAGAVLGEWFDFDLAAEMLGADLDSTIMSLEQALAADLLRPDRTGYRFSHALVRETLFDSPSLPRRQRLHFAAANAMERVYGDVIDDHVAVIAAHYRLAGSMADPAKVVEYSLRAGEAARTVFAWEDVATHWQAALELMEAHGTDSKARACHLERLAEVMLILGWDFYSKRIAFLERALEAYRRGGVSEAVIRLHIELANAYSNANAGTIDLSRGMSHFHAADVLLSEHPDAKLGRRLYHILANAAAWSARTRDGLVSCERALSIDAQLAPDERLGAPVASGWHLVSTGKLAEGLDELEHAWEAASGHGRIETTGSFTAAAYRSDCAFYLSDPRSAYDWRRSELANSRLAPARRRAILGGMAAACCEAGDLEEAVRLQAEANALTLDILVVLFPEPLIAFRSGDWERARAMWTEALERHRRTRSRWCEADFACWLAQLYRVHGEFTNAEAVLREALAIGIDAPSQMIEMWTRPELAMLCARTGRLAEAEQHLGRCRTILSAGENWRGLAGRVALAEALSSSACERFDVAEPWFEEALRVFREWSLPWAEAEALCEWGNVLATAGRSDDAVQKFEAARAVYRRHGAGEAWLRHVDELNTSEARSSR